MYTLNHSIHSNNDLSNLSVDDMGEGTLVLTCDEESITVSIDQLREAVKALSARYPATRN